MPFEPTSMFDYFKLYGPFAVLFVGLLFYTLKKADKREEALIGVINKLNDEILPELRSVKEAVLKKTD